MKEWRHCWGIESSRNSKKKKKKKNRKRERVRLFVCLLACWFVPAIAVMVAVKQ